MGLFSSKKIVTVGSTVYNLAGDEKDRPDYLKSLVVRNVLSGTKDTMGTTLQRGYLKGPGIKLRSFYRWAQQHYTVIGMPTSRLNASASVPADAVSPHIPHADGKTIWVQDCDLDNAQYGYWVDQWMLKNRPEHFDDRAWDADIEPLTNIITVTLSNGEVINFYPDGFDINARYIFAYYNEVEEEVNEPIQEGPVIPIGSDPLPPTEGWALKSTVTEPTQITLKKVERIITEYPNQSGSTPTEETTRTSTAYTITKITRVYERQIAQGANGDDAVSVRREIMTTVLDRRVFEDTSTSVEETGEGQSLKRVTTMTTEDKTLGNNSYKIDKQNIIKKKWSPLNVWIYRIGSGITALDAYQSTANTFSQFYPTIPVRLANAMLTEQSFGLGYTQAKEAYKRATGGKFQELQDKIADNKDIKDIDHAYVTFGVSINVVEQSCRRYLWDFFHRMMQDQIGGPNAYEAWLSKQTASKAQYDSWVSWRNAQKDPSNPAYGSAEPKLPQNNSPPGNVFTLESDGPVKVEYKCLIQWAYIRKGFGIGKGKPDAKKGEFWFEYAYGAEIGNPVYIGTTLVPDYNGENITTVRMVWQKSDNEFEFLILVNLKHFNIIYDNKFVETTAAEGLADKDESSFIVPLHYGTIREMPIKDSTQMTTACVFIVFNSYVVKKQRWYQRGIFKILLVIVIAIISVAFTGGAGLGILGSNALVGGFFGLTGVAGAIVGSVVNALAALALTTVLEKASVALFGEVIGGIIASVLGVFIGGGGINFSMSGGLSVNWSSMLRVDNLLKLTDALGNGYVAAVQKNIAGMQTDLTNYMEKADQETKRINNMYYSELGYGGAQIDPTMFVDSSKSRLESRDTFLSRTLMTGSDIANMSVDMLNDFASLSTALPDAFTA